MAAPTCSPIPFVRERLWAVGKMPPSVTQPSQIDLKRSIFLPLHDFFVVSSESCVSKNSNFEFLEPKLARKGNHLVLIKGIRNYPKIIQKSIELKHTLIFFRVQNFFIFWSFSFDLKL
ncbi:hypothetical protein MTR67_042447 [Solanum verrucosum]|uniref:Uncharacterized protein n=1 Tax=Solanum verrucosum TaxID=315347 RepID=A0AAF0UMV0_SOLVR|nr:hypothetical protein MTR67_042447 [Solanum verrucosum]